MPLHPMNLRPMRIAATFAGIAGAAFLVLAFVVLVIRICQPKGKGEAEEPGAVASVEEQMDEEEAVAVTPLLGRDFAAVGVGGRF